MWLECNRKLGSRFCSWTDTTPTNQWNERNELAVSKPGETNKTIFFFVGAIVSRPILSSSSSSLFVLFGFDKRPTTTDAESLSTINSSRGELMLEFDFQLLQSVPNRTESIFKCPTSNQISYLLNWFISIHFESPRKFSFQNVSDFKLALHLIHFLSFFWSNCFRGGGGCDELDGQ